MKRAPRSRQRHDLYAKYHDYDSEISDLLGECGVKGINPRTAKLVFGEDGAKALDDLRIIARAKTETAQALNNSRTGVVDQNVGGKLKTILAAGLGLSTGGVTGAASGAIGQGILAKWGEERAARTLLNPTFTKWLKMAPETADPKRIDQYFSKLSASAATSPAFADDVAAFRSVVMDAIRGNSGVRAAAGDREENKDEQRR